MATDFAALADTARSESADTKRPLALIAYWRATLVSRMYAAVRDPTSFDPVVSGVRLEGGDLAGSHWQCLNVQDFRAGTPPPAFAAAVFARSDARIDAVNARRGAMKPPREPLPYPNEFRAECAPFCVTGPTAGRTPVRELPVFASVVVVRETRGGPYRLLPGMTQSGSPPPLWLSRRHFADSAYGSRTIRFGPFADYLRYVGDAAWLVAGWPDLMGFFDGSWVVATGMEFRAWLQRLEAMGIGIASGWIREGTTDMASAALVRQFDDLREWVSVGNPAPAFFGLCSGASDVRIEHDLVRRGSLVGHVGGTPLAVSQRACAAAVRLLPKGGIQGVNGPPGTGKTTLLRSMLADLVVRAALDGKDPPLVLATAATNQAVTNVIEAFGTGVAQEGTALGIFGRRWIPDVSSYGAYVRASARAARDDWGSQIVVFDPIAAASALGSSTKPSESALEAARTAMRRSVRSGEVSFRHIALRAVHDDFAGFWLRCASKAMNVAFATRSQAQEALKGALQQCVAAIAAAEARISAWEAGGDRSESSRMALRADLFLLAYGSDRERLAGFRALEKSVADPDGDVGATMRGLVDLSMRRYAFALAARWWEAEFLRRALTFRERSDRIEVWRLAACLTPCIVGTPDRLATVFTRWTYAGAKTMWGEADFVVVDEAGQAACDRAAAVFGYADRALVVGDTLQISPVDGDDAPMWGPALARRNSVFDADALERGLLIGVAPEVSSVAEFGRPEIVEGSVMRAASAASWAHAAGSVSSLGQGGWLLDHFRCRPAIIAFSNAGWYHGALRSRRNDAGFPYPAFGHIDVRDDGLAATSRRNFIEAHRAVDWLSRERFGILAATGGESLGEVVAVVTPFRDQAMLMRGLLKRQLGVDGERITCGTLHSLQGAERAIVMLLTAYSGSYFLGDGQLVHFMDRQGTLLNVAVSRARDAFIVIGDRRVFERARPGTPTAALADYLEAMR